MNQTIQTTSIPDLLFISRQIYFDDRGTFQENGRIPEIEATIGRTIKVLQISTTENKHKAFRGMHVEPWDKFITPLAGEWFLCFVDTRPGTNVGKIETLHLKNLPATQRTSVFIPEGVANSMLYLDGPELGYYNYFITGQYDPNIPKRQFSGNDPALKIQWPIPWSEMIISDIDKNNPNLSDIL